MRKQLVLNAVLCMALLATPVLAANEHGSKRSERIEKRFEKLVDRFEDQLEKFELPVIESRNARPSIFVGTSGEVRLHSADVLSNASTTMGVRVWNHTFGINVSSTTKLMPNNSTISNINVGDKVNIRGRMNSSGVVDATLIHDLTPSQTASSTVNAKLTLHINKFIERLRQIQARNGLPLTPFLSTTTAAQ